MLGQIEKQRAILLVPVVDEILGTSIPGSGFAQLLGDPFIGGGAGHRSVDDTPGVQFDDDKDEEGAKQQVVDSGSSSVI